MDNKNTLAIHEDREMKAALVTAVAVSTSFRGYQLMMEGYETNNPDLKKEGMKVLLAGSGLLPLAEIVRAGILPIDLLAEHLPLE